MKNKFIAILLGLSCLIGSSCYALSLNEAQGMAYDATCRVKVSDAIGTGVVIGYDDSVGKYLVLTNYHVVTTNKTAVCDFWIKGRLVSCQAEVIWNYFNASMPADFCLLGLDKDFIDRNGINNVPIAGDEDIGLENAFFVSAGCPKGIHTGAWKGVVTKTDKSIEFKPAPYPGQSGSGIFKIIDDDLWYVGTLTWLVGREGASSSRGAFIPVSNFYQAMNAKKIPASYKDDQEPWVAPPNYTECADEIGYSVIEIVTQNCSACTKALDDVNKLLDNGIDVSSIDVVDCDVNMKKKYKVDKFPTFALLDKEGNVVDTWYGYGCGNKILKRIEDENEKEESYEEESSDEGIIDDSAAFPVINEDFSDELVEDFRNRPSVEEEYEDVGFIDDSNRRWNNRNRSSKKDSKKQEPSKTIDQEQTKKQDSVNTGVIATRIGNELEQRFDKIGDQLVKKTNGIVNDLIKKTDSVIDEKTELIKKETVKEINRIKYKIFWYLVFTMVTAYLIARSVLFFIRNTVFKFFNYLGKKIKDFLSKIKQLDNKDEK